jgi:hypothetical protein
MQPPLFGELYVTETSLEEKFYVAAYLHSATATGSNREQGC